MNIDKDKMIADLQAEVESLRNIIAEMPGNVYWKNIDGFYLGCNKNVATILNLTSPEDIIGKRTVDIMGEELAEKANSIDLTVLATEVESCVEEMGLNEKGLPAIYLTRKTPLFNRDGEIEGLLGISFDITERKQIEQKLKIAKQKAEAANRAKSRFLAMISHELRTPLTSILGFANLLESNEIDPSLKTQFIQHISNSGNYLLSLINSLLDYNKLETNQFEFVALPLNLKNLIENEIKFLSESAKQKNLSISLKYADNVPLEIMSNSRIIRQILVNLIGNAIKFTEIGFITVEVSLIRNLKDSVKLQIAVEDTGPGIPQREQKSIFKRFYQLGNVYTRNSSLTGTGLGLAIVKKLVKILGGNIKVKSIPNQGSIFYFVAQFKKVSIKESPWLPYADHVKILAIQDSHSTIDLNLLLTNSLYEIVPSQDAINVILTAQQSMQPYDIIIFTESLIGLDQQAILNTLQEFHYIYNPLTIGLLENPSSAEPFFATIKTSRVVECPRKFQEVLTTHWQEWKIHEKKLIQTIPLTKNPYVLVVEDNELIQIIHKNMLTELGCKVDVTSSAKMALETLDKNYDLLFIDIGLPDIAGFELIKQIRERQGDGPQTPIVVLTGYSEEEERQYCLKAGANEVAVKPVNKETLRKILRHYINSKSASAHICSPI